MTYEQIVAKVQTYYADADASMVAGHYAVQVNVIGEGAGAFYMEITEGKVNVQPYDYVDRNAAVTAAAEVLMEITERKVSYTKAVAESMIQIEGDEQAAAVLDSIKTIVAEAAAEVVAEPVVEAVAEVAAEPVVEVAAEVAAEPAAPKAAGKKAHTRKRAVNKAASKAKGTKKCKKTAK
ncbi:MAG: SCP2 sterol-binding domain-containing protein [Lachnospiraceae bacterium]|nr:SCP2 sterol-binding domain-containing protein [Lachnospiraceae bacterium]